MLFLAFIRFSICECAIFEITESLSKALNETDITGKCPTQYIRPPFEHTYLHFGTNHEYAIAMDNNGLYLEGAYISYIETTEQHEHIGAIAAHLRQLGKNIKNVLYAIEITLSFSKKTKENAKDTNESSVYLIIDNEHDDIETTVEKHKASWNAEEGDFSKLYNSILHIAKSLLLINTKNKGDLSLKIENDWKSIKRKALKKYPTKKALRKALENYDKFQ